MSMQHHYFSEINQMWNVVLAQSQQYSYQWHMFIKCEKQMVTKEQNKGLI